MAIISFDGVESFKGCCVAESESNSFHDSDFYMAVWNEEKQCAERILFATTRAGCGKAFGSYVDVTPENLAKYRAYGAAQVRKRRIEEKLQVRREAIALRKVVGFKTYHDVKRLMSVTPEEVDFKRVETLLTAKLRSSFRKSLKARIIKWVAEVTPSYKSPLSAKQWNYV